MRSVGAAGLLRPAERGGRAALTRQSAILFEVWWARQDYCGLLSEEAVRKNGVLLYELLDEVVDYGFPQNSSSEALREFVLNEPTVLHTVRPRAGPPPAVRSACGARVGAGGSQAVRAVWSAGAGGNRESRSNRAWARSMRLCARARLCAVGVCSMAGSRKQAWRARGLAACLDLPQSCTTKDAQGLEMALDVLFSEVVSGMPAEGGGRRRLQAWGSA